jgi:hypothetical protein
MTCNTCEGSGFIDSGNDELGKDGWIACPDCDGESAQKFSDIEKQRNCIRGAVYDLHCGNPDFVDVRGMLAAFDEVLDELELLRNRSERDQKDLAEAIQTAAAWRQQAEVNAAKYEFLIAKSEISRPTRPHPLYPEQGEDVA